jgi:hypothetical protein
MPVNPPSISGAGAGVEPHDRQADSFERVKAGRKQLAGNSSGAGASQEKGDSSGQITVVIPSYGERPGHPDEGPVFNERGNAIKGQFHRKAETGKEFVDNLVEASKLGVIKKLVIPSHAGPQGIYMKDNQGLYTDKQFGTGDAATIADIQAKIKSGEIRLAKDVTVIFLGCYSGQVPEAPEYHYMASEFSKIVPEGTVIAPTDRAQPKISGGRETTTYQTDGYWQRYRNGTPLEEPHQRKIYPNKID